MISTRTMLLGAVLLIAAVVLGSEIWSARTNCIAGGAGLTTRQAIESAQRRGHGGPCGETATSRAARPIEVGLLFLSGMATIGSLVADVSAYRNAGWDD